MPEIQIDFAEKAISQANKVPSVSNLMNKLLRHESGEDKAPEA